MPPHETLSWRQAQLKLHSLHLDLDSWLTQIGKRGTFPEEPRWERETGLSVIVGQLDVGGAVSAAFRRPAMPADCVRFFRHEHLVANDYRTLRSPTRKNPNHASISAPVDGDDIEEHRRWWSRPERVRLAMIAQN
jgi:hypothetical protein